MDFVFNTVASLVGATHKYVVLISLNADSSEEVSKSAGWRHQMEIFSALLALYAGNLPVTGEFPSQRLVTRSFE